MSYPSVVKVKTYLLAQSQLQSCKTRIMIAHRIFCAQPIEYVVVSEKVEVEQPEFVVQQQFGGLTNLPSYRSKY